MCHMAVNLLICVSVGHFVQLCLILVVMSFVQIQGLNSRTLHHTYRCIPKHDVLTLLE